MDKVKNKLTIFKTKPKQQSKPSNRSLLRFNHHQTVEADISLIIKEEEVIFRFCALQSTCCYL